MCSLTLPLIIDVMNLQRGGKQVIELVSMRSAVRKVGNSSNQLMSWFMLRANRPGTVPKKTCSQFSELFFVQERILCDFVAYHRRALLELWSS